MLGITNSILSTIIITETYQVHNSNHKPRQLYNNHRIPIPRTPLSHEQFHHLRTTHQRDEYNIECLAEPATNVSLSLSPASYFKVIRSVKIPFTSSLLKIFNAVLGQRFSRRDMIERAAAAAARKSDLFNEL